MKIVEILLIIALIAIILHNLLEMWFSHVFYKQLAKDRKEQIDKLIDKTLENIYKNIGLEEENNDKNSKSSN